MNTVIPQHQAAGDTGPSQVVASIYFWKLTKSKLLGAILGSIPDKSQCERHTDACTALACSHPGTITTP